MKPETTWKENKKKLEEITHVLFADRVYDEFHEYISSSQALARREGIEEAMRVVEDMPHCIECICTDAGHELDECYFESCIKEKCSCHKSRERIVKALQEKLDTKGV